jgi:hypothetical protein
MVVLTACGGSGLDDLAGTIPESTIPEGTLPQTTVAPDDAGGGEVGTEADLEQAAVDMFNAYLDWEHEVYFGLLSRACRERLGFSPVDSHLKGRRLRADGAGIDLSNIGVDEVEIDAFTGDFAFVTLVLWGTTELFEESVPNAWIYEEGGWRKDDCANITEAQGGLEGYGIDRDDPIPYGGVASMSGWLFTVREIHPDGREFVSWFDVELEPAAVGHTLFVIELGGGYDGAELSTVIGEDLAFAMVNGSTVYGVEADCGTDDQLFLDLSVEAGPGDDIGYPLLCREVAAEHAVGMLLRITDLSTSFDYWFDLSGS